MTMMLTFFSLSSSYFKLCAFIHNKNVRMLWMENNIHNIMLIS